MPHSASAKKRLRQNQKRRMRNKSRLSATRTQIKKFLRLVLINDIDGAREKLPVVTKMLYKSASAGVIHRKKASRIVSRLTRKLNSLEAGQKNA